MMYIGNNAVEGLFIPVWSCWLLTLIKLKQRIDLEWEFVGVDGGGCDCRAEGKGATTEPLNKVENDLKQPYIYSNIAFKMKIATNLS